MDYPALILKRGDELATAVKTEMTLEDNRHSAKMLAVSRIMKSGDNPMTGKPHSFSSAEAMVNSDPDYARHLEQLRDAAANRIRARAAYDAALAGARLEAQAA